MNLFIRLLYALSPMLVLTNIECFAGQATSNGGEKEKGHIFRYNLFL